MNINKLYFVMVLGIASCLSASQPSFSISKNDNVYTIRANMKEVILRNLLRQPDSISEANVRKLIFPSDADYISLVHFPVDIDPRGDHDINFVLTQSLVWRNPQSSNRTIIFCPGINGINYDRLEDILVWIARAKIVNANLLVIDPYGFNLSYRTYMIDDAIIDELLGSVQGRELFLFVLSYTSQMLLNPDATIDRHKKIIAIAQNICKMKQSYQLNAFSFGGYICSLMYRDENFSPRVKSVCMVCPLLLNIPIHTCYCDVKTDFTIIYTNKEDVIKNSILFFCNAINSKRLFANVPFTYGEAVTQEIDRLSSIGIRCIALNLGNNSHTMTCDIVSKYYDIESDVKEIEEKFRQIIKTYE